MKRIIIMILRSIFLKKMYQQKKIQLLVGLISWPHPYHTYTDPLHHCIASATECNSWLILVIYPALAFFGEKIFWVLMTICIAARGEGFTVYITYKEVSWHWRADFGHIDNTYYWLHYLLGKTYCPDGYESQCKTQLDNMGCFFT